MKNEFVVEETVDEGGPLREFFSLVFEDAQKHIMTGGNNGFTFLHDVRKLADGQFFGFCQLIALSLLHGCPGPRNLIESVAKHMLEFQSFAIPSIKTVPDFDLQTKLTEINDCHNEEKFQRLLENFPERFYFGGTKLQLTLENKQNFIHNIIYHCCVSSCIEELNEVKKGLGILGIFDLMKRHGNEAIIELKLCEIKERDRESNVQKEQEEDIYYNSTCFVEAVEASELNKMQVIELDFENSGSEKQEEKMVTLEDIVRFTTGSKFVTHSMLETGTTEFIHKNNIQGKCLFADTCTRSLIFPINERYVCSSETFIKNITEDIFMNVGFGRV